MPVSRNSFLLVAAWGFSLISQFEQIRNNAHTFKDLIIKDVGLL